MHTKKLSETFSGKLFLRVKQFKIVLLFKINYKSAYLYKGREIQPERGVWNRIFAAVFSDKDLE